MQNNDTTQEEIENLKEKIKGWFDNPHQFNSYILFNYIKLSKGDSCSISKNELKEWLDKDFDDNFSSMKSNGGHNNGKIFVGKNSGIRLNRDLADFIITEYKRRGLKW
ncbi:hypothetical protein [Helicobacter sp. MIT 01-3238]|uniref:hypothetical protein n=1 Tax=Helicobacter sp. MIT 01-3238 TaxID=398627 RepID=UPI000E1EE3A9|nr:hypothetical protein [Helicobacter sp. MIT 01-3238]RDU51649.1 hypothetical protein CQA40_09490 [Helicobacter sp. MIT 01-3238]